MPIPDEALLQAARNVFKPVNGRLFLVGGAVRDRFLERPAHDLDLLVVGCTEADFEATTSVLARELNLHPIRPAGFPDTLRLVSTEATLDLTRVPPEKLVEDLSTRDFTINAMALDPFSGELVDPTGGQQDLERQVLRTPDPATFTRDPVRILRLYRFQAELGFKAEPDTVQAAHSAVSLLDRPSGERIREELFRLLAHDTGWPAIGDMAFPVLTTLFPAIDGIRNLPQNGYHHKDVLPHTLEVLKHTFHLSGITGMLGCPDIPLTTEDRIVLRLAALFHDVGKAETAAINQNGLHTFKGHQYISAQRFQDDIARLRPSNRIVERAFMLIRRHMLFLNFMLNGYSDRSFRKLINMMREDSVLLTFLAVADKLSARGPLAKGSIEKIVGIGRQFLDMYRNEGETIRNLPTLVSGYEVMSIMKLDPSPAVGKLLAEIMERQLDDPEFSRQDALALLAKRRQKGDVST